MPAGIIRNARVQTVLATVDMTTERGSATLAFRTAPMPAGIIRNARVQTVLGTVDMTTERGSATYLDRRHHASLGEA